MHECANTLLALISTRVELESRELDEFHLDTLFQLFSIRLIAVKRVRYLTEM